MWFRKFSVLLLTLVIFSLSQRLTCAAKKSYIVYLGGHSHGPEVSTADFDRVTDSHYEFLGSFLGSAEKAKDAIFYSYKRHINGFAATLEEEDAAEIAKHPRVLSVFPNQAKKLLTTHSWEFMLLEKNGVIPSTSAWKKARFGEDTILATLDSGVWPESASYNDKGYGPIPSRWKGGCENNTKAGVVCNRKLIGAKYFINGFLASEGLNSSVIRSPRDYDGHGTHTLSTAAGNFAPVPNIFGHGTAKGGSAKARAATYKVCWGGCYDADMLEAFDVAIHDGVDVLSVSIGADEAQDYFNDSIAIGSFHAVKNGIVVVSAAGNSGPSNGTVTNVAPWMITVGASTLDRKFANYVELRSGLRLKGTSFSGPLPSDTFYPLITGDEAKSDQASANDAKFCIAGTLNPKKVKGKILVCLRGENDRMEKSYLAAQAGAAGMILCNDKTSGNQIEADLHFVPASHINYTDGLALYAYINSTDDPLGFITATSPEYNVKPAPFVANFSSRGPNTITPDILKPDITAPGVDIIAAFSGGASPSEEAFDKRTIKYNLMSGTSMATPHVAGVVGLLKTLYPNWSPSAIKSAIMTTARTRDNTVTPMEDESGEKGTPFSHGAGHIRPNRAVDPGLVYDLTADDYLNFLCTAAYNKTLIQLFSGTPNYKCPKDVRLLDLNYPSITVPNLSAGQMTVTVTRKVKNVGSPGTYAARVSEPAGVSVSVEPSVLVFEKIGEEKSFMVTLKAKNGDLTQGYGFGVLMWSDGKHYVRSPIVVNTFH